MSTSNSIPETGITEPQIIDLLKVEVEHFYRAELQCEQRASWLLTLAFGALALVLNCFIGIGEHKIRPQTAPYLIVCAVFFFLALTCSIYALWPLQGRKGKLQKPFLRRRSAFRPAPTGTVLEVWQGHYAVHRNRAETKAARVAQALVLLALSIAAGGIAVLKNSGLF